MVDWTDFIPSAPYSISWGGLWRRLRRHTTMSRHEFNREIKSMISAGRIITINARLATP